jgi:hypothetical protein
MTGQSPFLLDSEKTLEFGAEGNAMADYQKHYKQG